jgi:putative oxidoreductase
LTAEGPQFGPPGYEINLLYIAGLLALILGGAGPLSIDRLRAKKASATALTAGASTTVQATARESSRQATLDESRPIYPHSEQGVEP